MCLQQQSYCVITTRFNKPFMYRMSCCRALLVLAPQNPVRWLAVRLMTNQMFDSFIILTIFVNMIILATNKSYPLADYIFTAIYTGEFLIKTLARGFVFHPYSYLRNAWNWLDFIVIILAYMTIAFPFLPGLSALRAFRALKMIAILPALKTIVGAIFKSAGLLLNVMLLMVFALIIISLFGLQIFRGVLRQKCVILPDPATSSLSAAEWSNYVQNWLITDDIEIMVCGNGTGTRHCPANYTCLPDIGENPNHGATSFDNFGWAMMTSFQIITIDYWENCYNMVLRASGQYFIGFFMVVIMLGGYYVVNLVLAVVASSYERELRHHQQLLDEEKKERAEAERKQRQVVEAIMSVNKEAHMHMSTRQPGDLSADSSISQGLDHLGAGSTLQLTRRPRERLVARLNSLRCCSAFVAFRQRLRTLVTSSFFETFITILIITNTIMMAIDYHNAPYSSALDVGNTVLTTIFIAEAVLKLTALFPVVYFHLGWNIFDFCVVITSVVEWILDSMSNTNINISIIRTFRILRVFKLAKKWKTLNLLIRVMKSAIGEMRNLTVIFALVIYIFAVIGMQLIGRDYYTNRNKFSSGQVPRWNFLDFYSSFLMVFRVLCGEWIEPLYECLVCSNIYYCVPLFILTYVVGGFLVLNLFLALLLASFGGDNLKARSSGERTAKSASVKHFLTGFKPRRTFHISTKPSRFRRGCCGGCVGAFNAVRRMVFRLCQTTGFNGIVLFMVILSSFTLTLDDKYNSSNAQLMQVLRYMDLFYMAFFSMEMFLKMIGLGLHKYFTSFWTLLDCFLVLVSWLNQLASAVPALKSLRSLRTLRALRPLRAISRWKGMRLVVNALVTSIPSISNVMLMCLLFWMVFGIAGVQLFGGKFFRCIDAEGNRLPATEVANRTVCESLANEGYLWVNAIINYDNILSAYLALLQVATLEGWIEQMADASDSTGVDQQPSYNANIYSQMFFIIFVIIGSFFILNLFIGVVIDNFNSVHKRSHKEGALMALLTEDQQKFYKTMRRLYRSKPSKSIPQPQNRVLRFFYVLVHRRLFEYISTAVISLNMVLLASEHHNQSESFTNITKIINLVFTVLFMLEAALKILGNRIHYFRQPWDIFDFFVVCISLTEIVLETMASRLNFSPAILRVFRVVRLVRLLRLIRSVGGIRKLIYTLVISLPALINIGLLLLLIMFMYGILGVSIFRDLPYRGSVTNMVNFETFANSMTLLFRLNTAGGWNDVMGSVLGTETQNAILVIAYFTTFVIFSNIIIINMYVAIILENFNEAQEQEETGVTDDDIDMFYRVWGKFDPLATQFLACEQLPNFFDALKRPFRIPKPNTVKIAALQLAIVEGNKVHCLDVLRTMTRVIFGRVVKTEHLRQLSRQAQEKVMRRFPLRRIMHVVSTTLALRREEKAAHVIQRAFRHWRGHQAQGQEPRGCRASLRSRRGGGCRAGAKGAGADPAEGGGGGGVEFSEVVSCCKVMNGWKVKSFAARRSTVRNAT
uniref:Sodium channel protein n=1 Tax=Lethenteron camtschaticum TaxID=980415 RepID=A0A2P0WL87_LETCA|nr:sodium channel Nav2 [Lethenteron camtschaticum]